jgi:molybdopterin molybdotransferase
MIPVQEAYDILRGNVPPAIVEEAELRDALGRVLAEDIDSAIAMPPFDKSAMDGFAVRGDDESERFEIVETIAAGAVPQKEIGPGQCARIMTGAMLPRGADKVVMVEHTEEKDGFMTVARQDSPRNICYLGEDIQIGDRVLDAGMKLGPAEIGVLASMGRASAKVYRRPVVGMLTTGSEIVEPGHRLLEGQIYNSNAYSIGAQVEAMGCKPIYRGIAVDEPELIAKDLAALFDAVDVVVISGGVSMGTFDYVPEILEELGGKIHFSKVAVKPGKPTVFGTRGRKVFFGLPGNPVSTFVIFEVFVKRFLYRMMGHQFQPLFMRGEMKTAFRRKKAKRTAFIPVSYKDGMVEPVSYHGSAHLHALTRADGILEVPAGVNEISEGSVVYVRQF